MGGILQVNQGSSWIPLEKLGEKEEGKSLLLSTCYIPTVVCVILVNPSK